MVEDDSPIYIMLGNLGNYTEALDSLEEALRLNPDFTYALVGKGIILAKLGRVDEAKQCAKKALEVKGESDERKPEGPNLVNDSIREEYADVSRRFRKSFSPNP